ncbi:helix-turn-helix domain-containing protein [Paenibacillus sp. YIM B09110]|uniref:helix-turn-helix domain-containing protein n=1 Tax=Paenibacillus sp. YIM B09110 TaxID=3126102 RepID=UPI00301C2C7A
MTQKELALAIDVRPQTFNGYMTSYRDVPVEILVKVADFFGVTTDYLLGRTDSTVDKDGKLIVDPR